MILKEKIQIDFKAYFSHGTFDFLKLGKTKEWIINNFPNPDGFSKINDAVYKHNIWTYGNIELHFDQDQLFLIFSDYLDELNGGEHLQLNKWFLEDTQHLKLKHVFEHLNGEHLDFSKQTLSYGPTTVKIHLKSNITLDFGLIEMENEDYESFLKKSQTTNQNEFEMIAFSLMAR